MSIEKVRAYLKELGQDQNIIELEESSATVEAAAAAVGTEPARIAKTMAFHTAEGPILILAAGDVKIDPDTWSPITVKDENGDDVVDKSWGLIYAEEYYFVQVKNGVRKILEDKNG